MRARQEEMVRSFCGNGDAPIDENGTRVAVEDVAGDALALEHDHPVQVFFLGFGQADVNIGRILAQSTGAEYRGSTADDLAGVIEELSGYF